MSANLYTKPPLFQSGMTVEKCDPLPEVTNSLILAALNKSDLSSQLRAELKNSPQTFNIKYDSGRRKIAFYIIYRI